MGVLGTSVVSFFAIVAFAAWEMREREYYIRASPLAVREDDNALALAKTAMQRLGKNPNDYRIGRFYGDKVCGRGDNSPDYANVIFYSKTKLEGWSVRLNQTGTEVHCAISPTK